MAIAFGASGSSVSGGYNAGPQTKTISLTPSGSNLFLIAAVAIWQDVSGTGSVTACTFNGVSLTKYAEKTIAGGTMRVEFWRLKNPDAGTYNLSVTVTGATDAIKVMGSWWTGVDDVDAYAVAEGYGKVPSVTLTTVADNCEVVDCFMIYNATAMTVGANQTSMVNSAANSTVGGHSYLTNVKTPAGSVTMSWSRATADGDWAMAAMSFKPAGAASSYIKTSNGLAKASVKTKNGLVIANIKTINNLA